MDVVSIDLIFFFLVFCFDFFIFQSTSYRKSICLSNWYTFEQDVQKNLIMLLIRSNKPSFLHGGPITAISYLTIINVKTTL